jgi:hypothetical protein
VVDPVLVLGLLVLAMLSRRFGYLFSHSFFLDEGWVADSVRAPLQQLRLLTSSTPIGWTLLLRLVPPVGPPERLRLLPIAFAVAAVVPPTCSAGGSDGCTRSPPAWPPRSRRAHSPTTTSSSTPPTRS